MNQAWSISFPDGVKITREKYEAMLREVIAARKLRDTMHFSHAPMFEGRWKIDDQEEYDAVRKQNEENGL